MLQNPVDHPHGGGEVELPEEEIQSQEKGCRLKERKLEITSVLIDLFEKKE